MNVGGCREDEDEHDELTQKLGNQIIGLEDRAAKHAAELSKVQAEAAVLSAELTQRQVCLLSVPAPRVPNHWNLVNRYLSCVFLILLPFASRAPSVALQKM